MKRILFGMGLISIMLFSCKKEHTAISTTAKTYNVNFNVGFSQSIVPLTGGVIKTDGIKPDDVTPVDTLKKYLNVLYYQVFDSNQHLVRSITQYATDTDFGTINSPLLPGNYTVAISAGDVGFLTGMGTFPFIYYSYTYTDPFLPVGGFMFPPFKANTFYKKMSITVDSAAASYTVNLDRIVAQLKVVVKDFIPYGANYMLLFVNDTEMLDVLDISNDTFIAQDYYSLGNLVAGSTNTTMYAIVANTTSPVTVEIKCVDRISADIFDPPVTYGDKVITGVTFKANETTILTGNLFTDGGNDGFTVTYDPVWETGDPTVIHF